MRRTLRRCHTAAGATSRRSWSRWREGSPSSGACRSRRSRPSPLPTPSGCFGMTDQRSSMIDHRPSQMRTIHADDLDPRRPQGHRPLFPGHPGQRLPLHGRTDRPRPGDAWRSCLAASPSRATGSCGISRRPGGRRAHLQHVVKTTVFLQDMAEFAAMNEVYARFFGDHRPARSTVAAAGLPRNVRVEIELVAAT